MYIVIGRPIFRDFLYANVEKSDFDEQEIGLLEDYLPPPMEKASSSEGSISVRSPNGSKFEELQGFWTQEELSNDGTVNLGLNSTNAFCYMAAKIYDFRRLDYQNQTGPKARLMSLILFFVPSFILVSKKSQGTYQELPPTAWLDGLRGIGSLFVLFSHYNLIFNPKLRSETDQDGYNILQWPMIRVVHSGGAAVGIFYIISGYALSHRALYLIRKGDFDRFWRSLASSTFRRAFRLFIPMDVSTFFAMLFTYANWYGKGENAMEPPHLPTFWLQFKDWWRETVILSDPLYIILNPPYPPRYDGALWTIPLEFQGSLVVFLILLGVARTKAAVRMVIILGLFAFCIYRQYTEMALFVTGVLIAEFSLTRQFWRRGAINLSKLQASTKKSFNVFSIKDILLATLFLISIYILGIPEGTENQIENGYSALVYLTPTSYTGDQHKALWFWIDIGGLLTVATIGLAPFLQNFFTTPVALYLGTISYSLYLVHVKILYTLGWHIVPKIIAFFGEETILQRILGHLIGGSLLGFIIVWAADVFSRGVDEKVVKFIRRATKKCFISE